MGNFQRQRLPVVGSEDVGKRGSKERVAISF
jgi:hypothetical protein